MSFESRGRSRQVSRIALYNQPQNTKHITRHHQSPPLSQPPKQSSPNLSRSYLSPPTLSVAPLDSESSSSSPSSSIEREEVLMEPAVRSRIEDQLHIAYAHDDILRAKILLLKLKGIEVSSEDDPRIAEVQDEDFDICFIPNGGLVIEEQFCTPRKAQDPFVTRQDSAQKRANKLRVCELVWAEQKRVSKEEKVRAQRRKAEEAARVAAEVERARIVQSREQDERRRQERVRKSAYNAGRSVVSYSHLQSAASPSKQADLFTYALPSSPSPTRFSPRRTRTAADVPSLRQVPSPAPSCSSSRAQVSFEQVLTSMSGPLFPEDDDQPTPRRPRPRQKRSTSGTVGAEYVRQQQRNVELLDFLLAPPKATASSVGKQVARPKISRRDSGGAGFCGRCSATVSATSSSSSSLSGASRSWFSFKTSTSGRSSAASSSVSTAITTPSTSPPTSSWLKAAPLPYLLSSPTSAKRPRSTQRTTYPRLDCHYHAPFRISVAPEDCPLRSDASLRPRIRRGSILDPGQVVTVTSPSTVSPVHPFARGLTQLFSLAKSFQTAYVTAAVFSYGVHYDVSEASPMKAPRFAVAQRTRRGVALNDGRRARKDDVKAFLSHRSPVDDADDESDSESGLDGASDFFEFPSSPARYIPLMTASSRFTGGSWGPPQSTRLPNPLPYTLHFKPEPQPSISPHRTAGPWRIRQVGNPVCLRLRAAKNRMGINSAVVNIREGRMHEGAEKLFSVAFDVRVESRLGIRSRRYLGNGEEEVFRW